MRKHFFKLNILLFLMLSICACGKKAQPEEITIEPEVTSTSTPSPTPTASPLERCLSSSLQNAENTSIMGFAEQYINALYDKDYGTLKEMITEDHCPSEDELDSIISVPGSVTDIRVFYKNGIGEVEYFVYAVYDLIPNDSNMGIPVITEFGISLAEGKCTVYPMSLNDTVEEALLKSRLNKDVAELYIETLLAKYSVAVLSGNEEVFSETVTDSDLADFDYLYSSTQLIDSYSNYASHIYKIPDSIEDYDYVVIFCKDIQFINIDTPAPAADEYFIKLDDNNIPYIFLGTTSEAADNYLSSLRSSFEYTDVSNAVTEALLEALESDASLNAFYQKLYFKN